LLRLANGAGITEEALLVLTIAKCLCATGTSCRKGSRYIPECKRRLYVPTTQVFVKKASIEAVARSDRVDHLNVKWSADKAL
jgi:hypothetical protein